MHVSISQSSAIAPCLLPDLYHTVTMKATAVIVVAVALLCLAAGGHAAEGAQYMLRCSSIVSLC